MLFTMLILPIYVADSFSGSFFRTRVVEDAFYFQAPTGFFKGPGLYAIFRIFSQRPVGPVGLDSP
jgi:hypothetical protein